MFLIALYVVAGMVCLCTVMKDFGPKGWGDIIKATLGDGRLTWINLLGKEGWRVEWPKEEGPKILIKRSKDWEVWDKWTNQQMTFTWPLERSE